MQLLQIHWHDLSSNTLKKNITRGLKYYIEIRNNRKNSSMKFWQTVETRADDLVVINVRPFSLRKIRCGTLFQYKFLRLGKVLLLLFFFSFLLRATARFEGSLKNEDAKYLFKRKIRFGKQVYQEIHDQNWLII